VGSQLTHNSGLAVLNMPFMDDDCRIRMKRHEFALFAKGGEWDASVERWRHQFSHTGVIRVEGGGNTARTLFTMP
jgi:hypothetical protein